MSLARAIQGFETLRKLNKRQFDDWLRRDQQEVSVWERSAFMNRLFNVEAVLAWILVTLRVKNRFVNDLEQALSKSIKIIFLK